MALSLRPVTAADLDDVLEVHLRSEAHDAVPRIVSMEELVDEFDGLHVRFETDTVAAEIDGRLVGYAYTYHLPSEVREERCYVFGQVDPDHRREGVGRALLDWTLDRARTQLRSSGSALPKFIRAERIETNAAAAALFDGAGLEPVRWNEELLRPLDDPPATTVPEGIRIVPWVDVDPEEIRRVKNAAFADHWGSTPSSEADWAKKLRGPTARLDLSFVALDADGAVVGYCFNARFEADDELLGRREGWIDNLGTLAEHRGRGVASALVVRSLHAFADAGLTHASIGVDADNPSGAARLYRSLGFERLHGFVTHQEVVSSGTEPTGS